ncbi:MAG: peptide-methionine (R)-S-oxide reductase MsrB [Bacteroidota bacterium]|nr:peptide-methionine (R)-S-oxide reductase MsrB [Bacteroidota bacterium]
MKTDKTNSFISKSGKTPEEMSNEEWKNILPKEIYHIAREKGTERAGTGTYYKHNEVGTYYCVVCGNPLFKSDGKFNSSCGWPSFFEPITKESLIYLPDNSFGMRRTEVQCGKCRSHLGHVFEDGPPPTGLRYCINSVVLGFSSRSSEEET